MASMHGEIMRPTTTQPKSPSPHGGNSKSRQTDTAASFLLLPQHSAPNPQHFRPCVVCVSILVRLWSVCVMVMCRSCVGCVLVVCRLCVGFSAPSVMRYSTEPPARKPLTKNHPRQTDMQRDFALICAVRHPLLRTPQHPFAVHGKTPAGLQ